MAIFIISLFVWCFCRPGLLVYLVNSLVLGVIWYHLRFFLLYPVYEQISVFYIVGIFPMGMQNWRVK